ncbi:MAG TPA: hypothetical protein VGN37_32280 [Actinocatenispora sp.]
MATHRHGPADQGASGYSAGPYQSVDYPSTGPSYPADSTAERRYAERIPRYPDGESGARDAASPDEDQRRGEGARPPAPARPAPPRQAPPQSGPAGPDEPTGTYPAAPSMTPPGPTPQSAPTPQSGPTQSGPTQAGPTQSGPTHSGTQPGPTQHPGPNPQPGPYQQPGTPLSELLHDATQYTEPVASYPPAAQAPDNGVYHAGGKPQLAWILAGLAVLFELPVAYVLVRSLAASGVAVSGVVSALFLLPGVPLFAAGVYHLFSGHITVRPGEGLAALVRRPLALLLVGVVLLLAAAVAAG